MTASDQADSKVSASALALSKRFVGLIRFSSLVFKMDKPTL